MYSSVSIFAFKYAPLMSTLNNTHPLVAPSASTNLIDGYRTQVEKTSVKLQRSRTPRDRGHPQCSRLHLWCTQLTH